jgi:hypothetical protein
VTRLIPLIGLGTLIAATLGLAADDRAKVPPPEDVEKATKSIHELFKDDYAKATTPKAKLALAELLYERGLETKSDPAARFVMLREAAELAATGDMDLALRVYDSLRERYAGSVADLQEPILKTLSARAATPDANLALTIHLLRDIDEALAADDLDGATRLLRLAEGTSYRSRNARATAIVGARGRDLEAFKRDAEKVREALATLKDKPADPDACLVVGKYHSFQRGDWEKGLPLLAKCSDEKLKAAAAKDLREPVDPTDLVAAADAWYDTLATLEPYARRAVQTRAYNYYAKALPNVTGLTKTKVEKRIDELDKVMEGKWEYGELWASLRSAVRTNALEELREVGGAFGNKPYRDLPPDGALLVGFHYSLGNAFGGDVVFALQPIYLTATGERVGAMLGKPRGKPLTLKAKTGYALGSMKVRGGGMWEGFAITFMRIDGKGLKPSDSYETPWVGRKGDQFSPEIGDGRPVVGIHGKLTNEGDTCSIGLLVAGPKPKGKGK